MIEVLVVSDHPVVRAGLGAILAATEDCRVAGEATLEQMAAQVAALGPDVVLLEVGEDEPDEVEALWHLAAEAPTAGILVISRDPGEARARQALQAGARGYLLWDVAPEEIVAAVRAVYHGLAVLHPTVARAFAGPSPVQPPRPAAEPLTPRELEVLQLLAQGLPSKTIAARLHVSEHTVKFHVGSVLAKLGAASRTEAVTIAIRRGLLAL